MLETYGLHELVWDACDERFSDMLVASPADAGGRGISLAVADLQAAAQAGDFDGEDGADGFSPTATVTQTATGATITITDKNGTTTADIAKGAQGEKGDTGDTGPQGPQGEASSLSSHSWFTLAWLIIAFLLRLSRVSDP